MLQASVCVRCGRHATIIYVANYAKEKLEKVVDFEKYFFK